MQKKMQLKHEMVLVSHGRGSGSFSQKLTLDFCFLNIPLARGMKHVKNYRQTDIEKAHEHVKYIDKHRHGHT